MKNKTVKFRLSEENADILDKIAKELKTTKSEVIRNGIPKKISSKMFNDLLSFQNLVYLEGEARRCVSNFENGIAVKLEEISNEYPAYVVAEKDKYFLQVKFPTFQLNLNDRVEQDKLKEVLSKYSPIEVYSSPVYIYLSSFDFRESVLCLDQDLNSNQKLAQSIIDRLSDEGLNVTLMPHYYLKSYELKIDSSEEYALGIKTSENQS